MKKRLTTALCAMILCASCAQAANVNFVTAGTSSTFYPISATVVSLWNEQIDGMRATATPSGGGIDKKSVSMYGLEDVRRRFHSAFNFNNIDTDLR